MKIQLRPQGTQPPPIFGRCLLWPNGWMDQDATWYGGRPRPRLLCVRWGPCFPKKGGTAAPPHFSVHVYCGQTAGWIRVPLATETGLGPGRRCVTWRPRSPYSKGYSSPDTFRTTFLWHGRPSQLLLSTCSFCLFRAYSKRNIRGTLATV